MNSLSVINVMSLNVGVLPAASWKPGGWLLLRRETKEEEPRRHTEGSEPRGRAAGAGGEELGPAPLAEGVCEREAVP